MKTFLLSGTSLGVLASGYFYPYALMQIPMGLLSDSWGPRKTVTVFGIVGGFGAILFGLAPNFFVATLSRILVGFGLSGIFVPSMKVCADWFKTSEYARISGVFGVMGGIGWLIAAAPLALITDRFGWRAPFIALGFLTCLLALLTWGFVVDTPGKRGFPPIVECKSLDGTSDAGKVFAGIKVVVTNVYFWPLALNLFSVGGILFGFCGLWAGPYLMDTYKLSKPSAGNILSMVAIGIIVGSPVSGYLSDKLLQSRKKVILGSTFFLFIEWCIFYVFYQNLPLAFLGLLFFLLGVFSTGVITVSFPATKELFSIETAGTSLGTVNFFLFFGGAIYQPLIGYFIDLSSKTGGKCLMQGYRMVFMVFLFTTLLTFISLIFMKEKSLTQRLSNDVFC